MGVIQDLLDLKDELEERGSIRIIETAAVEIDNLKHDKKSLQAQNRVIKEKVRAAIETATEHEELLSLTRLQEIDLMLGGQDETA